MTDVMIANGVVTFVVRAWSADARRWMNVWRGESVEQARIVCDRSIAPCGVMEYTRTEGMGEWGECVYQNGALAAMIARASLENGSEVEAVSSEGREENVAD